MVIFPYSVSSFKTGAVINLKIRQVIQKHHFYALRPPYVYIKYMFFFCLRYYVEYS